MSEPEMQSKGMKQLLETIAALKTSVEVKKFLRDVCTLAELCAMSERWQVAKLVQKGTPYRAIAQKTGSSTATITRVAQWLYHGMGGYKLMLHRLGR